MQQLDEAILPDLRVVQTLGIASPSCTETTQETLNTMAHSEQGTPPREGGSPNKSTVSILRSLVALSVLISVVVLFSCGNSDPADLRPEAGLTMPRAESAENAQPARNAAERYAQDDLEGAVIVLREAVETNPQGAQLHFMLANALFRQEDWAGAIQHYSQAARLREHHPDTYLDLGFAQYRIGNIEDAVAAWSTAVRQSPNDALPHLSLALGLRAHGLFDVARRHIVRAIELDPQWQERLAIDLRWTPGMIREVSGS